MFSVIEKGSHSVESTVWVEMIKAYHSDSIRLQVTSLPWNFKLCKTFLICSAASRQISCVAES